jgi:hypothetical protein
MTAASVDAWMWIGTTAVTVVLLLVPGVLYAWYVLEHMIDDRRSYEHVIRSVYRH